MIHGDTRRFRQAAALLPPALRGPLERLDQSAQARAEELRMRAGLSPSLVRPEGCGRASLPCGGATAWASAAPAS